MRSRVASTTDQSVADEKKQKNVPRSDHFGGAQSSHGTLAPQSILQLQRTMGNAYVRRMLEDGVQSDVQRQAVVQRQTGGGGAAAGAGSGMTQIGHFGQAAEGPDSMSYADYLTEEGEVDPDKLPNLSPSAQGWVNRQNWEPDWGLKLDMQIELGLLAGDLGLKMVDHFYSGAGGTYTHGVGSYLSEMAKNSDTFTTEFERVQTEVAQQLSAQYGTSGDVGGVDIKKVNVVPQRPSFGFMDGFDLKGIIGGTQEVTIFVRNFKVDPETREWTADVRWEILDDFGAGHDDLYSFGLTAFWILQHMRPGHLPFVNKLVIDKQMSGTL